MRSGGKAKARKGGAELRVAQQRNGEVLRNSDTRWLGIGTSRLDAPGKAMAWTCPAMYRDGMAK